MLDVTLTVDRALRARFFSPEIAMGFRLVSVDRREAICLRPPRRTPAEPYDSKRHRDPPCDQSLKPFGIRSGNFAARAAAEQGSSAEGEQAERGAVGRGLGMAVMVKVLVPSCLDELVIPPLVKLKKEESSHG